MKKLFIDNKYKLAGIIVLIITVFFYKATDLVIFAKNSVEKKYDVYALEVGEIPVLKSNIGWKEVADRVPASFDINNLTSKAVYIEDVDTATQLFEKNGERLLLPASTTKIMTALVVRDEYSLDEYLTVPNVKEIEGFSVGLFTGEKMLVRELLKAALIQSSNDAAYTLAMNHPDGLDGFVKLMNIK